MNDRLIELIDYAGNRRHPWADLEHRTGISRQTWRKAYNKHQAVTGAMIIAIGHQWPRYICWFVTGTVEGATDQASPAIDRAGGLCLPLRAGSTSKAIRNGQQEEN